MRVAPRRCVLCACSLFMRSGRPTLTWQPCVIVINTSQVPVATTTSLRGTRMTRMRCVTAASSSHRRRRAAAPWSLDSADLGWKITLPLDWIRGGYRLKVDVDTANLPYAHMCGQRVSHAWDRAGKEEDDDCIR